jgi:dTDP-4-dehydrorhamnose reductase
MLGHRLYLHLRGSHDARVTLHRPLEAYAHCALFDANNAYERVDAGSFGTVERAIEAHRPHVVVNGIGIVKQRNDATQAIPSIEINALFPHRLAVLCRSGGTRLIHISTDCVYSGRRGNYNEADAADADDLYGRSKLLGEVSEPPVLTLRTSMIGRELARKLSLLEWFLAQRGTVRGFRRAVFSGFTTTELARVIEMLIVRFPDGAGLYHVSSAPITKFDLLTLIRDKLALDIAIEPDDELYCDRSLDSSRFRSRFEYSPPSWEDMVTELAKEMPR